MFPTTPTRRTVLRAGAVVLSGSAASSPVIAVDGQQTPPDGEQPPTGDGPPRAEPDSRLWPRLYKGLATVELTYIRDFDRIASGEFDVDVEFSEPAGLEQATNPFVLSLIPTRLRGGNVVVTQPREFDLRSELELTEGALTISTDVGESQFWTVEYAAANGGLTGQHSGLAEESNYFRSLHPMLFGEPAVLSSFLEGQSTFTGTVRDDRLSLTFDLLDTELRVRCRATVTADRTA